LRTERQTFRVTHPFHPLYGREFCLADRLAPRGRDHLYFTDETGTLRKLPTAWTDYLDPDPWMIVAAGRSAFRIDDLLLLVDLIETLKK
jgi:hypothetical protein